MEQNGFFEVLGMICFIAMILVFWVWPWLSILGVYQSYKLAERKNYPKKSNESEDFMIEREGVLEIIQSRIDRDAGLGLISSAERKEFAEIYDSSEVASLFRCAHYAGFHLTFEQDECGWNSDREYLDPDVFKTDMNEAATLRKERELNEYKRYYDPPKSRRDRALGR